MSEELTAFLKYNPLRNWLRNRRDHKRQLEKLAQWEKDGRPAPPPHIVKQRVLRQHAQDYHLKILVETGTYKGDMVEAMRPHFDRIYSIELSPEYHRKAVLRFRNAEHVEILQGDSGEVLGELVPKLDQPTLFWLDGHYSGGNTAKGELETPIYKELTYVLEHPIRNHVIVIDDARCFGVDPDYPTIDALKAFLAKFDRPLEVSVEHDSIRITPAKV